MAHSADKCAVAIMHARKRAQSVARSSGKEANERSILLITENGPNIFEIHRLVERNPRILVVAYCNRYATALRGNCERGQPQDLPAFEDELAFLRRKHARIGVAVVRHSVACICFRIEPQAEPLGFAIALT